MRSELPGSLRFRVARVRLFHCLRRGTRTCPRHPCRAASDVGSRTATIESKTHDPAHMAFLKSFCVQRAYELRKATGPAEQDTYLLVSFHLRSEQVLDPASRALVPGRS